MSRQLRGVIQWCWEQRLGQASIPSRVARSTPITDHGTPKYTVSQAREERQQQWSAADGARPCTRRCACTGARAAVRWRCCGRHCEHGQIYCAQGCAQQARKESVRRAGARHQRTRNGRRSHADRQAQYRALLQKVTHQGPPLCANQVQPWVPGLPEFPGGPDKETPNVVLSIPLLLPLPQLLSVAIPSYGMPASSTTNAKSSVASDHSQTTPFHTCHFCKTVQSRYLRRLFLFELRRGHPSRIKRGPP